MKITKSQLKKIIKEALNEGDVIDFGEKRREKESQEEPPLWLLFNVKENSLISLHSDPGDAIMKALKKIGIPFKASEPGKYDDYTPDQIINALLFELGYAVRRDDQ